MYIYIYKGVKTIKHIYEVNSILDFEVSFCFFKCQLFHKHVELILRLIINKNN